MAREKRRNSEKRKEKSRDAARCRRSKETEIFTELAECLPLSENIIQQLDKASIMRLAISQLKIGDVLDVVGIADTQIGQDDEDCIKHNGFDGMLAEEIKSEQMMKDLWITNGEDKMENALPEGQTSQLHMKAMEGTVIILSSDGDFVYLSGNVAKYLGMQQIELMGQSIYEYIHPCDHEEIKNALNPKSGNGGTPEQQQQQNGDSPSPLVYSEIRTFSIRMKCTLTTKGRSVNLKSAPYKVMKCSGRLVSGLDSPDGHPSSDGASPPLKPYLLAMIEPIPHPSNIEVPLDSSTFLSKHEMDMSFIFCDDRVEELVGYDPNAVLGKSFFDFHHALDSEIIKKTFKDLYSKGQAMTPAYRMLAANGGYIWLVTQATTINNSRNQKPQSIVCIHYVLSGVAEKGIILSNIQEDLAMPVGGATAAPLTTTKTEVLSPMPINFAPLTPTTPSTPVIVDDGLERQSEQQQQQQQQPPLQIELLPPKLELNTESIFAPRTKTMEKAVVCPPAVVPYLTDDPDDLSCLSPMAGDEMIPLPFTTPPPNNKATDFLSSPMLPMAKSPPEIIRQTGLLSPGQFSAGAFSSDECSRPSSPDYLSCAIPLELESIDKFFAPVESTLGHSNNVTPNSCSNNNNAQQQQQQQQQQQLQLSMPATGLCLMPTTKQELLVEELRGDELDIDFAMRAPYIPMDSDQDHGLLPPSTSTLFNMSDFNPSVCGRTESVFGPKETLYEEPKPIPKRSLRDMLGESTVVASIEQPLETKYLQMKRPLDMNCLEKGPPASKTARLEESVSSPSAQPCQARGVNAVSGTGNKNSVLLNLLLTGEDISYGYKVSQKPIVSTSASKTNFNETSRFDSLTRQDCEVNAPIRFCKLLHGQELVNALDL